VTVLKYRFLSSFTTTNLSLRTLGLYFDDEEAMTNQTLIIKDNMISHINNIRKLRRWKINKVVNFNINKVNS